MAQPLPNLVNTRALVERRAEVVGCCSIAKMTRLRGYLGDDRGEINVALAFGKDDEGWFVVTGSIQGEVMLQCQRCLELMPWQVNAGVALALVTSEEQAKQLGEAYEPRVISEAPLSLHELIEDEMILAMPIVARHPEQICGAARHSKTTSDNPVRTHPFDVLGALKKKH